MGPMIACDYNRKSDQKDRQGEAWLRSRKEAGKAEIGSGEDRRVLELLPTLD